MSKNLIRIIIIGSQILSRAFAKALKQEMAAGIAAGKRSNGTTNRKTTISDMRYGITLDEAIKILNVNKKFTKEEVNVQYEHLFKVNENSLYLQSKVVQAKERLDKEIIDSQNK